MERRCANRATMLLPIALAAVLVGPPQEAHAERWPIAITGDSIVESSILRSSVDPFGGFGRMVQQRLGEKRLRIGGTGFIPMHSSEARFFNPISFSGGWLHEGLVFGPGPAAEHGPDGLPSLALDSSAKATVTVKANRISTMYSTGPGLGRFSIKVGSGPSVSVNTRRATSGVAMTTVSAPLRANQVTISGFRNGQVRLTGFVASVRRTALREIEVDQLGRGGATAESGLASTQEQALRLLRPKLTVIMFGTNEELPADALGDSAERRERFAAGLAKRSRIALESGGCLIVPHAPNTLSLEIQSAYDAVAEGAARTAGCDFQRVFAGAWDAEASVADGYTRDGIHPTPKGYALLADRLAAAIAARLAR